MNTVIRRLRRLEAVRRWVQQMDGVLEELNPAERLLLQKLILHPEKGNAAVLCQVFELEESSLYRRRQALLRKLRRLPEEPD